MTDSRPSEFAPGDLFVGELTGCQAMLRGYCEAALGHGEDAKDAWQRTNIVLWRKAQDWNPATKFLPWALSVARYEVLAVIRDRQRERIIFDNDVAELMADTAVHLAETSGARRDALTHCLTKLNPRQRTVLSAHYLSGHTQSEIASEHGMGLSAVKVLLLRLRRSLAECIEKHQLKETSS